MYKQKYFGVRFVLVKIKTNKLKVTCGLISMHDTVDI